MATQADKQAKARLQSQKLRQKEEKKSVKKARKVIGKESNYLDAFYRARKVQDNVMGLPPVLWPLVLLVGLIWARNTWEKESQERDLREAREFLRQSSSKRI